MNTRAPQTFRKRIATILVSLLMVHVLLCIYFTVTPRNYILHRSIVGSVYHRVFLIGPFFTEERIASSTRLYMRYKIRGGSWSKPISYTDRVHRAGTSMLFKYNDSRHDDLLRYFARAYRPDKTNHSQSNRQLCVLCQYSINELIPQDETIDSLNLVFIHNTFVQRDMPGKSDTLWNVTLNPSRCVVR